MSGVDRIAAERARQLACEGWTPEHDDEHDEDQLAIAAACYALPSHERMELEDLCDAEHRRIPEQWPWDSKSWKPGLGTIDGRIRDLEKAGALIAAEIDRLLRIKATEPTA